MDHTFINDVTTQLNARKADGSLTGWSLKATESHSLQRLFDSPDGTGLSCHQSRRVIGDAYQLSVYTPAKTDGMIGTASLDLVTYRSIEQQLTEAIELAQDSQNRAWKLAAPPADEPAPVKTCDPQIRDNPEAAAEAIEQEFTEAFAATSGCALNSAELFLNYHLIEHANSEGLSYQTELSELYLEAAMEKAGQENDKEVHEYTTSVTGADLNVKGFIEACALQVATLGDSEEPQTTDSATILIDKEALSQMLETILGQLNCASEYQKVPFLNTGDTFGGGTGDPLTLKLDPTIPCMVLSAAYTGEGLPARGETLIEKNRVMNRVIGNRFGQYLELTPNGNSGNIIVEPGSLTEAALAGQEYTEIIKFSSLLIDSKKLTWSSEIKLGRHVAADGTVTLVKGGVVSGNLKDNFTDCQFSATVGTVNVPRSSYAPPRGYRGPDSMLITRGVSIAGQEAK